MDNFDWLAELASDCLAYGESQGLPNIVAGVHALVDALEMDIRMRAQIASRPVHCELPQELVREASSKNIVQFRPRKPSTLGLMTASLQL